MPDLGGKAHAAISLLSNWHQSKVFIGHRSKQRQMYKDLGLNQGTTRSIADTPEEVDLQIQPYSPSTYNNNYNNHNYNTNYDNKYNQIRTIAEYTKDNSMKDMMSFKPTTTHPSHGHTAAKALNLSRLVLENENLEKQILRNVNALAPAKHASQRPLEVVTLEESMGWSVVVVRLNPLEEVLRVRTLKGAFEEGFSVENLNAALRQLEALSALKMAQALRAEMVSDQRAYVRPVG